MRDDRSAGRGASRCRWAGSARSGREPSGTTTAWCRSRPTATVTSALDDVEHASILAQSAKMGRSFVQFVLLGRAIRVEFNRWPLSSERDPLLGRSLTAVASREPRQGVGSAACRRCSRARGHFCRVALRGRHTRTNPEFAVMTDVSVGHAILAMIVVDEEGVREIALEPVRCCCEHSRRDRHEDSVIPEGRSDEGRRPSQIRRRADHGRQQRWRDHPHRARRPRS
jgi:hypothetical protein